MRVPDPDKDISLLADGSLRDEVRRVVDRLAAADAVLATGHVSVEEALAVSEACADAGTNCLVNHAFFRVLDASPEDLEQLVDRGATLECCAYSLIDEETDHSAERVAEAIATHGAENVVLATDFGQVGNPPAAGLARFMEAVIRAGAPESAVREAVTRTPARLLGL